MTAALPRPTHPTAPKPPRAFCRDEENNPRGSPSRSPAAAAPPLTALPAPPVPREAPVATLPAVAPPRGGGSSCNAAPAEPSRAEPSRAPLQPMNQQRPRPPGGMARARDAPGPMGGAGGSCPRCSLRRGAHGGAWAAGGGRRGGSRGVEGRRGWDGRPLAHVFLMLNGRLCISVCVSCSLGTMGKSLIPSSSTG